VHDANAVEDARIIICKTYKRGSKDLIAKKPPVSSIKENIKISEYYNSKIRNATNSQFTFKCKITINKDVWKQVEKYGANIGIKQIKNILLDDPILISQKSKQKGVRCIKPEKYGWIFSTSYSLRLVAKNAHPTTVNPKELVFSIIEKGH
jgi:hypothetical protein